MQLTKVQSLSADFTRTDVHELIAVMQSTLSSSPANILLWGEVLPSDAQEWLLKAVGPAIADGFKHSRIAYMLSKDGSIRPTAAHSERLVIRDLDLDHLDIPDQDTAVPPTGRIISHADYRYYPSYGEQGSSEHEAEQVMSISGNQWLRGMNTNLNTTFNSLLDSTILTLFKGLPCFALHGISTLTPSHLRKGCATQLVEWVFPYADHFSLPVVLCASPPGLPMYRKCGFDEYREHDIRIELERFGGEGVHVHVTMVRWPVNDQKMLAAWKKWRAEHKSGVSTC